ncbi:MAG: T9SS type A sorting domain-containing protein [Bacteroidales bacterium]|nr:T9SS type A sorting domain-containing protein [Bacteroidales bacterium]
MVKILRYIAILLFIIFFIPFSNGQIVPFLENEVFEKDNFFEEDTFPVVIHETFEDGMPFGWSQQYINSPDGFNAQWNTRTGAGQIAPGNPPVIGEPDSAAAGNKNLVFQWQGQGHITRLISAPIDLEFIVNPVLTFYHAQVAWGSGQDRLVIYYRKGDTGDWIPLRQYMNEVPIWIHRSISLNDHETDRFYFALEGINGHGSGVCIDEFRIIETGYIPKVLNNFTTEQASYDFMPTGSNNNPILRSRLRVTGNTGELRLLEYIAHSQNTDDNDIDAVKLYWTEDEVFNSSNLVASANGFSNGVVTFDNLTLDLPTGYSYLWLAYDISDEATHGNFGDAYIPAGGITVNGDFELLDNQNPPGEREIYQTIFYDDFDTDKGWILTGEFERDVPQGLGGSHGNPGANSAYTGENVLGTDLTGLGDFPGDYEPGIDIAEYAAITPILDCFYYKDVTLTFHRWLNTEFTDKANIHISTDGGESWTQIWQNPNFMSDLNWLQLTYNLPQVNRKDNVKIRFSIGPTDALNNYSGWNIDNLVVTGEFITYDVGVSEWIGPDEGCGMSDNETVTVTVNNYGAWAVSDPIPLGFSLDGGLTWHMDTLYQNIPVGGSVTHVFVPKADFSVPGRYNNIKVKTFWELDQDAENNGIVHSIFSIPYISPPYTENFNTNDGLWTAYGENSSWQWGTLQGEIINNTQEGNKAWGTNRTGSYNSLEASWVESPCFNFSETETPVMEFYLNTHTPENMDGIGIQYSLDEGAAWEDLSIFSEELAWNWYSSDDDVQMLADHFGSPKGWHGNSQGWIRVRAIMEPAIAQEERVKFRMIFASQDFGGQSHTWEGAGFDRVSIYESPHDVGVTAIIDPVSSCELSNEQTVTISLGNFGLNALESGMEIPVGLDVDTIAPVYETLILQQNLMPGATVNYTFNAHFDLSAGQDYQLTAYTLLPGDNDFYNPGSHNDTLSTIVTVFGYPEFSLGDDIYTTMPDTLVLDAGEGFQYYLWQDGSEEQTFQVTSIHSAYYTAWVTDYNGCQVSDSLEVIARDIEVFRISQPLSNCELSDNEMIEVEVRNSGPDVIAAGTQIPLQIFFNEELHDQGILTLAADLAPSETAALMLFNPFDFSEINEYVFRIVHSYQDADPANNVIYYSVFNAGFPQPFIGDTIYTTEPHLIILDAGAEFSEYLWQDGSTDQFFVPDNTWSAWYHVTVTDPYGCQGSDSVFVLTYDIEIVEIFEPQEACGASDNEPIGVRLLNHGPETFDAGREFPLILRFDGQILSEDTLVLDQSWSAGQELEFWFNAIINMELPQSYDFQIYQRYRDANTANDTLEFTIYIHGYPAISLPPYIVTDFPETLTLEPGAGYDAYLWQDGSTSETYDVQTWGHYWVEVSNDFGCTSYAQTYVLPELFDLALHEILSPDSVCAGGEEHYLTVLVKNTGNSMIVPGTQLTMSYIFDGATEVTESFTVTELMYSGDELLFTFNQPVYTHNPGYIPVTASVNFAADEIEENNTLSRDVFIYDLPQPYLGDDIYTTDPQSVVLSPGGSFESYVWQDGSTDPVFQVEALNSAMYTVTVTDQQGCINSDTVMVITYNLELDSIIAPASHCTLSTGEPVIVRVLNEGYDDFTAGTVIELGYTNGTNESVHEEFVLNQPWPRNTFRTFTFNSVVNMAQQGMHEFTAFVATPNAVPETDVMIAFVEYAGIPVVDLGHDIYTSRPDTVVLDAGPGFMSYTWHDGQNGQTYNVSEIGWKWVFVTDIYGCVGSDTTYVGFYTNIPGLDDPFTTKVYPNPAKDQITIEFSTDMVFERTELEIMDVRGNMIFRGRMPDSGTSRETLDVSFLQPGVYLLNIRRNNYNQLHKITIIR